MKELYITFLLAVLCLAFGKTAVCPRSTVPVKYMVRNPMELAKRLQMIYGWNHYRGIAVIKADSLGITPEECLASMNDGIATDDECEFYSSLYNKRKP